MHSNILTRRTHYMYSLNRIPTFALVSGNDNSDNRNSLNHLDAEIDIITQLVVFLADGGKDSCKMNNLIWLEILDHAL